MFRSVVVSASLFLLAAGSLSAANMLPNPNFNTNTAGWTAEPDATIAWSSLYDAEGITYGSAMVTNVHHTFNGQDMGAVGPCIAIDPNTIYTFGGQIFFETSAPAGNAFIHALYYTSSDCSGTPQRMGYNPPTRGTWSMFSVTRSFAGMYSLRVRLAIMKTNAADTSRAFFDNLFMDVKRVPSVTSFSPIGGFPNNYVEVYGNDFYGLYPSISFNGAAASEVRVYSETHAQARIPLSATASGPISFTNINGTGTSSAVFHLPPRVDAFTPGFGKPGTAVTVTGINFHDATNVRFGTVDGLFIRVSPGMVVVTVPARAVSAPIQVVNGAGLGGSSIPHFVVVRRGDFSRDGRADILLRDAYGNVSAWIMNGISITSTAPLASPGSSYSVAGVADFNGDGTADVLITDTAGNIGMWLMDGTTITTGAMVGPTGPGYSVVGTGDFDGNGKADILLRDGNGTIGMWMMNGATIASGAMVGSPGGSYTVAGVGDFDADYRDDILLRDGNGNLGIWFMNGSTIAAGGMLSPAAGYTVVGIGDFNADDRSDLLLRDGVGNIGMWLLSGASIYQGAMVSSPGLSYNVAAVKDYDGDNRADILLRDSSGNLGMWLMDGPTIRSSVSGLVGYPGSGYTSY